MIGALLLAPIVLLGTLAEGHIGCGGQEIAKRNPYMVAGSGKFGKRQSTGYDKNDMDPQSECTGYSYPPVTEAASQFPAIWQTAQLVAGDNEASTLYNTINDLVTKELPGVGPKGTLNGDFSGFTPTYNTSDPDCWWTYRQCTTPKNPLIPADITTIPEPLSYGIGFDDGPNCSHNAFYQYLQDQKVKATMFYIGSNVMDWPLQAKRGLDDGHELAVHTWSHQYLTAMTNEQVFAELYYTRQAIKLVTGVTPKVWRPPFGDIDNRVRLIASQLNMTAILWEEDSEDWRINTGTPPVTQAQIDANYQSTIDHAKNGSFATRGTIMLTHELNNFTMSEAIKWIPALKEVFTGGLVPVASGMNWTTPYVETNVTFPSYGQAMGLSGSDSISSAASSASATGSMSSTGTASATASDASASQTGTVKASASAAAAAATTSKGAGEKITVSAGWGFALGVGIFGLFL